MSSAPVRNRGRQAVGLPIPLASVRRASGRREEHGPPVATPPAIALSSDRVVGRIDRVVSKGGGGRPRCRPSTPPRMSR